MKFKDLVKGQIFTYWDLEKNVIAIKIGEEAIRLSDGQTVKVHHSKNVHLPESVPEDAQLVFGRNGQAYLISPFSAETVNARRVLVVTTEIMHKQSFSPRKIGGDSATQKQVDIMLSKLVEKLQDLESLTRVVQMIRHENMSAESSDKNIMLPSRERSLSSLE